MSAETELETNEEPALILVVDDTAATRYISSSWLRRHGHQVIEAATGTDALASLARWRVDLVLLDIGLPDMSGFDICERIKKDPLLGQPVIHLSATAVRGADRARGLTRGADAYLTEPVDPAELVATVGAVLRRHRARMAAEGLADRLARLTKATLEINEATDFDELTLAIANGAATIATSPAVALVSAPNGLLRRANARPGDPYTKALDMVPASLLRKLIGPDPDGRAVGLTPVDWETLSPRSDGPCDALAAIFGSRDGHPLGIVLRVTILTDDSRDLLAQLGHVAVLAADALRLYTEEHTLALTLQRSFLTSPPATIAGLDLGVRYVPAASNAEIGGDFYEFLELDDNRLLVAIGDVAGHSIHAATVMVELRHALRAYASEGHDPADILRRLERMLRRYHPREFATLCLLVVEPGHDRLRVANAGHLPPLLADSAGTGYIQVTGPMLGIGRDRPDDTVVRLSEAWSLVLITDGLIEEPGRDIDEAMEQLRSITELTATPEELCDRMLAHFSPRGRDDIALLVLRRGG